MCIQYSLDEVQNPFYMNMLKYEHSIWFIFVKLGHGTLDRVENGLMKVHTFTIARGSVLLCFKRVKITCHNRVDTIKPYSRMRSAKDLSHILKITILLNLKAIFKYKNVYPNM